MSVYRDPESAPRLPRAIKNKPSFNRFAVWAGRLIILPHSIVGAVLIGALLISLGTSLLGQTTVGSVSGTGVHRSKSHYSYDIQFSYNHGGSTLSGSRSFSLGARPAPADGERYSVGQPVTVRHFGLGPLRNARMELPGESAFDTADLGGILVVGLFWNGILSIFWYQLWYVPFRNRRLFSRGTPVPGRVTRKNVVKGKGVQYFVEYSYTPWNHSERQGKMTVSTEALWNSVAEGQRVLVLHDPEKPGVSVVYECGDHEWVEPPEPLAG